MAASDANGANDANDANDADDADDVNGAASANGAKEPAALPRRAPVPLKKTGATARNVRLLGMFVVFVGGALYAMTAISEVLIGVLVVMVALLYRLAPVAQVRPRRMLAAGAGLLLFGLALVGTGPYEAGIGVTLLALIVLIFGIHTFGRLGPDEEAHHA